MDAGLELIEVMLELGELPFACHVAVVETVVDDCDLMGMPRLEPGAHVPNAEAIPKPTSNWKTMSSMLAV